MREASIRVPSRAIFTLAPALWLILVAPALQAQLPPEIIDSTGLSGPIDDFTSHTFVVGAGPIGSFAERTVIRRFASPIDSIRVTVVDGDADDIGFVGTLLVTDVKPRCAGVGRVLAPVDVTSAVTVTEAEASLVLRAQENCCCVTGWGSATQGDRRNARLHWEVTLREAEYKVELTTFIPADHLEGPFNATCGQGRNRQRLFFEGDDRGFGFGASSFRSRQRVTVVADENVDADGIKDGSVENLVGETRSYAPDALADGQLDAADDDGILNDCVLLHDRDTADASDMSVEPFLTPSNGIVAVLLRGGPGNPLVRPSCDIDWNLNLQLREEGGATNYVLSGVHDGFPAYELYVNGHEIYRFDPGPGPFSFADLLRLCVFPVTVLKVGTLP
jgi:hypothetical protein